MHTYRYACQVINQLVISVNYKLKTKSLLPSQMRNGKLLMQNPSYISIKTTTTKLKNALLQIQLSTTKNKNFNIMSHALLCTYKVNSKWIKRCARTVHFNY